MPPTDLSSAAYPHVHSPKSIHIPNDVRLFAATYGIVDTMTRTLITAITLSVLVVLASPSSVGASESEFDWPLHPRPQVVRAFDKPEHNWLPGHRGVDLAGRPDEAVLSAGEGVVVFAGVVADKPVVSVDHAGGLRTTYEPVHARVRAGQRVGTGTVLGILEPGHPGCTAAACLHWGLRRDREYLNPLGLVDATPLRLKPLRPKPLRPKPLRPGHARG